MKVSEIVNITGGKLLSGDSNRDIDLSGVSTDTRTMKKGDFFIALSGPNFEGDRFVDEAFKKGAIGAIVTQYPIPNTQYPKVIIRVKDSTRAMQDIAHCHRMKFKIPVICITGSNGKTTTKDMICDVLSTKYDVLKNEGTKNNHIGVPQTLLRLKNVHDIGVLELGANHKGEIGVLAGIAMPTVAVITNTGPSHLEFLEDLKGVYGEKRSITKFLGREGTLIINGDDEFLSRIKSGRFRIVRYGLKRSNDFQARLFHSSAGRLEFEVNGKKFHSNIAGRYNLYNALAAVAVGSLFRVREESIRRALAGYRTASMRMNFAKVNGFIIINDAYNSNPLSMRCALETISSYPARARWVVSGDMLELGRRRVEFHRAIGRQAAACGIEGLLTFGKLSKYTYLAAAVSGMKKGSLWHCTTHDEIAAILKRKARKGDAVLVKGSRAMGMEKVVEILKESCKA